jgi:hypothetical protein
MKSRSSSERKLDLKAGEWVEVLSEQEILATLDENGCIDNLPFMPEMFHYCGQRLRVYKRSDKTCDNIVPWSIRRMENSVHLEDVRCDGGAHGGCEAGCLIFWNEAWLKRVDHSFVTAEALRSTATAPAQSNALVTVESILAATQKTNKDGEVVYSCQATEMRNYTTFMRWWDPRQYIRDVRSGNVSSGLTDGSREGRILELLLDVLIVIRAMIISIFRDRRGVHYPFIPGALEKTPIEVLNLQPGELVEVRRKEEIVATLDADNRNRGLLFDCEMLPYCGGIYRVLRRVHHIINEKNGKMMDMKNPCIVLEGVICKSDYHRLCPKAIYSYWRENWLKRATPVPLSGLEKDRELELASKRGDKALS